MKLAVIIPRKLKMHVSCRYTFLSLCFHSNSKLDPVNSEQPEKHARLEKFIFTYLWLLSALGKMKHLVILAKVFSTPLPSKRSSQRPTVFPHTSFCWLKKKKQNYRLPFSTSLCERWFQCILVLLLGCPASY